MKTICLLSGLPLYKTPYLLGFDLADIHPIFRAKRKLILTPEIVHKFSRSEATFEEKKLIFLAVFNATELVEFEVPAMPTLATIESNFYRLINMASWLSHAEYTYKQIVGFPRFVVRADTADLSSIRNWITSIEELKDQAIRKDIDRDRAASLSQKETEIRREIAEATLLHRAFTPSLARWSLDFSGLSRSDDRYNRWIKILCSPLTDAWVYEIDELRDIEEFFLCNLPSDHPQVISVNHQIRTLIKECKKGFTELAIFNDSDETGSNFEIIEEDGTVKKSKHLENVPLDEPQQKDYPTKVQFLVAQAKWRLSQRKNKPEEDV